MKSSISQAETYEEMAEFWDVHDTTEYADSFEEVAVEMHAVRHRHAPIEPSLFEALRAEARRRGISTETLINLWLMERLRSVQVTERQAPARTAEAEGAEEAAGVKG